MVNSLEILKITPYSEFYMWDVKRFVKSSISSKYDIVELSKYIAERSEKIKLFNFPDKEFGILGVNNKIGLFDAYKEFGKNINQAYKRIDNQDLAYNPYRVNVGSIGWKTKNQKNDFISPAYVVFETNNGLTSEFLYIMFKTDTFNQIIRDNTTGSVRQNLKFNTLSKIRIPLPPLAKQNRIVANYNAKIKLANEEEQKVKAFKQEIGEYMFEMLGVNKIENNSIKKGLRVIGYSRLTKWALSHTLKQNKFNIQNSKYSTTTIRDILLFFKGGKTPSKQRKDFWNGKINWTSPKDFNGLYIDKSEDHITEKAVIETKIKKFPAGTLVSVFRSGILRHSFPTAIINIPTTINQDLKAYDLKEDIINKKYYLYFTEVFKEYILINASKKSVTVESINTEEFLELKIPLPPLDIQTQIANHISGLKQQIKDLKNQAKENREKAIQEFDTEIFTKS